MNDGTVIDPIQSIYRFQLSAILSLPYSGNNLEPGTNLDSADPYNAQPFHTNLDHGLNLKGAT